MIGYSCGPQAVLPHASRTGTIRVGHGGSTRLPLRVQFAGAGLFKTRVPQRTRTFHTSVLVMSMSWNTRLHHDDIPYLNNDELWFDYMFPRRPVTGTTGDQGHRKILSLV